MSTQLVSRLVHLGALYKEQGSCEFSVWAPLLNSMAVKIVLPEPRLIPMEKDSRGMWTAGAGGLFPGAQYYYRLNDEKDRPDPASRFQPEGVHGPSELIDPNDFVWEDDSWQGIPLRDYVIYEIHTGAFTSLGTFEAAISRLDYLKDLNITALEIMPVAQFPGKRNWGYDGVYPFAPQNSYGGPPGLKALVNACHAKGIAVILDVVYNHLGPDGNYLNDFGPYFTDRYRTPWGDAVNFDGPYSDGVRSYFINNALYWITEYHIDGLRLDAIHNIFDFSAKHFLSELAEKVHKFAEESRRMISIIAESDLNDVTVIRPRTAGGYGLDGQWSDDFHHALHTLLTGECKGYYQDFGKIEHLEKAFKEGFVYSGQYSFFRKRNHGNSSKERPAHQFVVSSQNHDQVGNRMLGERLSLLASFEQLKLASGCVLLSPYIPLLFMGEEYGELSPFLYFVSHIDEPLIQAVRDGRANEFVDFEWNGTIPDPQDEEIFQRSKIDLDLRLSGKHKIILSYYTALLKLRKSLRALSVLDKEQMNVIGFKNEKAISVRRYHEDSHVLILFSFNERPISLLIPLPAGRWTKILDSSDPEWGGNSEQGERTVVSTESAVAFPMNVYSVVLYELSNGESR